MSTQNIVMVPRVLRLSLLRRNGGWHVLGRNNAVRLVLGAGWCDPFRYVMPAWQRNGRGRSSTRHEFAPSGAPDVISICGYQS